MFSASAWLCLSCVRVGYLDFALVFLFVDLPLELRVLLEELLSSAYVVQVVVQRGEFLGHALEVLFFLRDGLLEVLLERHAIIRLVCGDAQNS